MTSARADDVARLFRTLLMAMPPHLAAAALGGLARAVASASDLPAAARAVRADDDMPKEMREACELLFLSVQGLADISATFERAALGGNRVSPPRIFKLQKELFR
jgi:hypothetical protein